MNVINQKATTLHWGEIKVQGQFYMQLPNSLHTIHNHLIHDSGCPQDELAALSS